MRSESEWPLNPVQTATTSLEEAASGPRPRRRGDGRQAQKGLLIAASPHPRESPTTADDEGDSAGNGTGQD